MLKVVRLVMIDDCYGVVVGVFVVAAAAAGGRAVAAVSNATWIESTDVHYHW